MSGKVILIADDEPENAEIIRAVVEDILGHTALLADNGQLAVQLVTDEQPDLVLMDLMMPVLNGFAAIEQLKGSDNTKHIPLIALTALSRAKDQQAALDSGADDFVSKPFDLDTLSEKIELYLHPVVTDAVIEENAESLEPPEYDQT